MRGLIITALSVLVLSACGGEEAGQEAQESESPTPSATTSTPTPTETPTPSPTPTAAEVEIGCYDYKQDAVVVGEPEELAAFWSYKFDDCYDSTSSGTPSDKEQRALETAYPKNPRVKSLSTLYGICAENDKKWMNHITTSGSPSQLLELRGALILCPDHPQRKKVQGFVKIAEANNQLIASGRVFYDGTYRVGQKVPAGTFYAEPDGDGCYWERTDSAGNIIDNSFSNGLRVEMTVSPSDYSIKVDGCGEWRPVGQ